MSNARSEKRKGSVAIEFALVGPLLILLLTGMVVYGGWLWLAQSVQSLASESARAAVGGLDDAEKRQLALAFVAREAAEGSSLEPSLLTTTVTSDSEAVRVRVSYDAQGHPILLLAGPLPKPPTRIERSAVVRIGGY